MENRSGRWSVRKRHAVARGGPGVRRVKYRRGTGTEEPGSSVSVIDIAGTGIQVRRRLQAILPHMAQATCV
jgi:hypothetical protein